MLLWLYWLDSCRKLTTRMTPLQIQDERHIQFYSRNCPQSLSHTCSALQTMWYNLEKDASDARNLSMGIRMAFWRVVVPVSKGGMEIPPVVHMRKVNASGETPRQSRARSYRCISLAVSASEPCDWRGAFLRSCNGCASFPLFFFYALPEWT